MLLSLHQKNMEIPQDTNIQDFLNQTESPEPVETPVETPTETTPVETPVEATPLEVQTIPTETPAETETPATTEETASATTPKPYAFAVDLPTQPTEAEKVKIELESTRKMLEDPFIKSYLQSQSEGKVEDFIRSISKPDYSSMAKNNPRSLVEAYASAQDPDISEEGKEASWEDFSKGRDPESFSLQQRNELKAYQKELEKSSVIVQPSNVDEAAIQKRNEDTAKLIEEFKTEAAKVKVWAREDGTGGYQVTDEDTNTAVELAQKFAEGAFIDPKTGLVSKSFFNLFLNNVLAQKALPYIADGSFNDGKRQQILQHANTKPFNTGSPVTTPDVVVKTTEQANAEEYSHLLKQM